MNICMFAGELYRDSGDAQASVDDEPGRKELSYLLYYVAGPLLFVVVFAGLYTLLTNLKGTTCYKTYTWQSVAHYSHVALQYITCYASND